VNLRRLFLSLAVLLPGLAGAAPALRVLPWDDEIAARKFALVSGESVVEIVNLHPAKRSGYIRVSGSAPVFLRALDKQGADGKPAQRACTLPESMQHPLLLLLPDEKDPTGVRTVFFDDDPAGFRWGGYRFLNATRSQLDVQLERKIVRVPPGWKPVDLHIGGETRGIGTRLGLPGKLAKPLYSAVWEFDTEVRTLCFLIPSEDARRGPIMVKAVVEDRKSMELEAKAAGGDKSEPATDGGT
jgi:hypothetical protein